MSWTSVCVETHRNFSKNSVLSSFTAHLLPRDWAQKELGRNENRRHRADLARSRIEGERTEAVSPRARPEAAVLRGETGAWPCQQVGVRHAVGSNHVRTLVVRETRPRGVRLPNAGAGQDEPYFVPVVGLSIALAGRSILSGSSWPAKRRCAADAPSRAARSPLIP